MPLEVAERALEVSTNYKQETHAFANSFMLFAQKLMRFKKKYSLFLLLSMLFYHLKD